MKVWIDTLLISKEALESLDAIRIFATEAQVRKVKEMYGDEYLKEVTITTVDELEKECIENSLAVDPSGMGHFYDIDDLPGHRG
tara:strand:+ start:729 stop:980 length:252 start_codon:yes stop_codon:yes gene_type:complete